MSNPWETNEPTDKELWDELNHSVDTRRQEIYFVLGQRAHNASKHEDALALFDKSLELCELLGYTREKYYTMVNMTRCHRELKNWDKVFEIFDRLEERGLADLEAEDLALLFRSKAFALKDQRRALDAIEAFRIAENYSRECDESYLACNDAIQRARIHALLREFTVARDLMLVTLEYARVEAVVPLAAQVQLNLGRIYLQAADFPAAVVTLEDAVATFEAIEDEIYGKKARMALAAAHGRNGNVLRAEQILVELDQSLNPWDIELRASISLLRAELSWDPAEVAEFHKKARALAANDGRRHFVNVVDINAAVVMAEAGDLAGAENLLREVIASAEKFDDLDIINEARVRLASIVIELDRADEALSLLSTMSIATFGDDSFAWQRFAIVHSAALLLVGEIDEAEQSVMVIMNLERTWANLAVIAEAYWITAQIEEKRHGRTSNWEHMLSASVALLLQAGKAEMATERARDLVPAAESAPDIPRQPLKTPNDLLDNINAASDG
ncbi:MAG: MalT-like region [Actinomycetota bacterium]|jgi:tetratricopeptide (TPR) repeat protein